MKKINQKRIEKKKKKRKLRIEKFKNKSSDQNNVRDSYTAKTSQELDEYMAFIQNNAEINPTNELTRSRAKIEKKESEPEKEEIEERIENSDAVLPQSIEENIGEIKKRKPGHIERLKRSFYRKWPDNVVDLLFKTPSAIIIPIIVAWASYNWISKPDINDLRNDISNPDGDLRKALIADTAKNTLAGFVKTIDEKILSNNQNERRYTEELLNKKIRAIVPKK